ncbi:MAG TPA: hydroxymethylbilane synthase [Longimicrobiales bacterium]|nr:hydroxymethylbilane synthase [Longimicrobiales bacterium]
MRRLRLGTRGSRLARAQSEAVASELRTRVPELEVEIVPIETFGDLHRDVALKPELGQSFFTKEIESALLAGRIDLAVHSCKDLATVLPEGLRIGAVPPREDPRDVLVANAGGLADLAAGARVGTSSPRRKGFLAAARPDIEVVDLRGNVPTRVAAVDEGRLDGIVLAAAGLRRLGMAERISEWLEPGVMTPAAAQGALAVQTREDDEPTNALVAHLDHAPSRSEVTAERACLRRLEAGCQAPVGVLARTGTGKLSLSAAVVAPGGVLRAEVSGPAGEAESLGVAAAEDLLGRLGLDTLRGAPWAGKPPERIHA